MQLGKAGQGSAGAAGGMPDDGGRACWWLAPLHELMLSTALSPSSGYSNGFAVGTLASLAQGVCR